MVFLWGGWGWGGVCIQLLPKVGLNYTMHTHTKLTGGERERQREGGRERVGERERERDVGEGGMEGGAETKV